MVKPGEVTFQAARHKVNKRYIAGLTLYYTRRSCVVQKNIVLNIQIGTPVTNFNRPLEFDDLEHRVVVPVMYYDLLLFLFDERLVRGRHIIIWSVSDSSSRFRDRFRSELGQVLWLREEMDFGSR